MLHPCGRSQKRRSLNVLIESLNTAESYVNNQVTIQSSLTNTTMLKPSALSQLVFVIVRWIGVERPNEARYLRLRLQPATSCRRTHNRAFDLPKRHKPAYLTFRQITCTSFRLLVIADSAFGCEDLTGCDSLAMRGHIIALASKSLRRCKSRLLLHYEI